MPTILRILDTLYIFLKEKYKRATELGTEGIDEDEELDRIKSVNKITLAIQAIMIVITPVVIFVMGTPLTLSVYALVFILNILVLVLNQNKKRIQASVLLYCNQCISVTFFGLLFVNAQLQFAIIFLLCILFIIIRQNKLRRIGFAAAIISLIILQTGTYLNIEPPLAISKDGTFIIQCIVIAGVLAIIALVSKTYVDGKDDNYNLKRTNHFKKVFIYQITHELRTPLNAIYGVAQLLKKEIRNANPDILEDLTSKLLTASENTRNIVNNVLDMAQIEAGKIETSNIQAFMVHPFFTNIIEVNKVIAGNREIEINLHLEKMPDVIFGDALKLNQITTNLLANAIKYAHRKTTIFVHIRRSNDNLDKWMLQVINNGPGISPEKLPFIFEPFITDKRDKNMEGTGLGLYIVKNKVESMNGTITVECEPSGYTVFTATLPLMPGWLKDVPVENNTENFDFNGLKIFVAEDDPISAFLLCHFLQIQGCIVTHVKNGHEVLEKVQSANGEVDLIIMDYHMPGLDGLQILKLLKNHEVLKDIPVIIATGDTFTDSQNLLFQAGADAVVDKPINHKMLSNIINRHLPQKSRTA